MSRQSGSRLGKGGCPGKSDLNDHRVAKLGAYRTSNRRYKNKVRRATKRYKNCPQVLEKVLEGIVRHRKGYKKRGSI